MINRKLVKVACIGLAGLFLVQIGLLGRWGLSRADIQSDGITFVPATPVLDEFFIVWGYSSGALANVELGIDRWEYAVRTGDVPWDSSGHEDNPDYSTGGGPFQWGWDVKITQPGDYVFTFYKDCDTGCTVVAQETIIITDPYAAITFEPPTPTLGEFFIVWGEHATGLADVEMGIDHWEYAVRTGEIPWDSSGHEDNPDHTEAPSPFQWGWDVKISQPGDYVFTFYKDCDTGCIAVAQETVNISDPTPTDTPTNTPTATPTPKGERLPTPDPLHTPAPTQPSYTDSDADYIPDTIECPWMPCRDTDGDGVPDYLDSDSDGDGISDKIEGTDDPDPDGIPNYRDLDSDDDTIPDSIESFGDTDNDGTPNFVDLDSDADGLSDEIEGTGDIDGDGVPNFLDNNANDGPLGDADGDGILNGTEDTDDADGDSIPDPDADGDGIKNKADTDSDGDNIHDIVEGRDDPDLDSIPNYLDLDSDGDTIPDEIEGVPDYLIPNDLVYLPLVLGEGQMIHNLIDAPNECVAGQVAQIGHSYRDDFDWLSGAPSYYYDKDWFTFEAVSGQSYVIETFDLGARTDTVLDLYSPNCQTMLAENDDVVPNEDKRSRIVWVAPTSGTYHVLITQWDYVTHGVETQYTFRISSGAGADMLPIPPAAPGLKPPRPAPPPHSTGSGYTSSGKGTSAVSIPLFVAVSIPVIVLVLKQRRQASRRAPLEPLGS